MAPSRTPEQNRALAAANRGAGWLLALQQANGSLEGARTISAYYKAPFALTVTGHNAEAERLFDYIQRSFLKADGDLDGAGVDWFEKYRTYAHAWLAIAALMRGRFEIAHPLLRTLVTYYDPQTGGFFATRQGSLEREGNQEIMTTSLAGLACLWQGRLDLATRTGQWLNNVYNAQPDLSRGLYEVWHSRTGLITDFPESDAKAFLVDARQREQWYFQYGISAAFLASLSAATQEKDWLALARKFLAASKHCRGDVYSRPASGKIGWGAAWCYRLSGEEADRKLATTVTGNLRTLQNSDGSWSASGIHRDSPAPVREADLDVTAEFTGLLGCIGLIGA